MNSMDRSKTHQHRRWEEPNARSFECPTDNEWFPQVSGTQFSAQRILDHQRWSSAEWNPLWTLETLIEAHPGSVQKLKIHVLDSRIDISWCPWQFPRSLKRNRRMSRSCLLVAFVENKKITNRSVTLTYSQLLHLHLLHYPSKQIFPSNLQHLLLFTRLINYSI